MVEQVGGFVADVGFAEAAEACGRAFGIAVAADLCADVVGFGIKGFFVQLLGAVGQKGGGNSATWLLPSGLATLPAPLKLTSRSMMGFSWRSTRRIWVPSRLRPALDVGGGLDA